MKATSIFCGLRGLAAVLLLAVCTAAHAQAPAWSRANSFGGTSGNSVSGFGTAGETIAVDAQGNYYVSGAFVDLTLTLGTTMLTNADNSGRTSDLFVAKYSPLGVVLWAVRFGGPQDDEGSSVAVDAAGNVYVAGYFNSTITVGTTTLVSAGASDVLLFKLNGQGVPQWAVRAGGALDDFPPDDTGYPLVALGAGTSAAPGPVWLGASFQGTATLSSTATTLTSAGDFDQLLVEFNATTGAVVRSASAGGTGYDVPTRLAVDASNGLYVIGVFDSPSLAVGATTLTHRSQYLDSYLLKYNSQLAAQWATSLGATGSNTEAVVFGLAVSPAGEATVAGASSGTIPVGSAGTIPANGNLYVPFIIRYSPLGQAVVVSSGSGTGGAVLNGLARDAAGNAYVIGYFGNTLTWGGVTLSGKPDTNLLILKLDATTLAPQWGLSPLQSAGGFAFALDVVVDAAANCYLTGLYGGILPFGTLLPLPAPTSPQAGFVAKLGAVPLAARPALAAALLGAWPNPVAAGHSLRLALPAGAATLRLVDITGRLVAELPLSATTQEVAMPATLAPGRYVAEVPVAGQVLRQALLIE